MDPKDPFDFSVERWNDQLVAGYSKTTPSARLEGAHAGLQRSAEAPVEGAIATGGTIMVSMVPLSVLDLSPIVEGGTAAQAFRNTLDLAQHAERWGYQRFWVAEHHNMPGIASAATAVLIGHVGAGTNDHPHRRRRHHAAESRAAAGRGAVRHAGVVVPRPRRSRPRARARHRSRGRIRTATHAAGQPRRISTRRDRSDRLLS